MTGLAPEKMAPVREVVRQERIMQLMPGGSCASAVAAEKKRDIKEEEKKDAKGKKAKPAVAVEAGDNNGAKLNDNFLYVQCVKVKSKIRLRIVNSTCYNNAWNCQGPRSIRRDGVVYRIDNPKVKVMYN